MTSSPPSDHQPDRQPDHQPEDQPESRQTGGRIFAPGTFLESSRTAEILRAETTGGLLLIVAGFQGLQLAGVCGL